MRTQPFQPSTVNRLSTERRLLRLLLALLLLAGTAVWAGAPASAAVLDASSRLPRSSLVDTSRLVPGSAPPEEAVAGEGKATGVPGPSGGDHAAQPSAGEPASSRWAVVIGSDAYQGTTADTIGSAADARLLTNLLQRHGWRDDHVRTLGDGQATAANIRQAFAWLARNTDEDSTVVVSFSGHMDHRHTTDGIVTGLWTQDNERLWRAELARMLGDVDADRMWISLQGCYAAGLAAPGVEGDDRLVTYSSHAREASYEDPRTGHSVMATYLFREGLAQGWGNGGNPRGVSVQEAFAWAAPRAHRRTGGKQTPVMSDRLGEPFTLEAVPVPE